MCLADDGGENLMKSELSVRPRRRRCGHHLNVKQHCLAKLSSSKEDENDESGSAAPVRLWQRAPTC